MKQVHIRLQRLAAVGALIGLLLAMALTPLPAVAQDPISYMYTKVNELRASKGLNQLTQNAQLAAAAQGHANYLASTAYIHPHRQRNGSLPQDRAAAAGYVGRAGENVVGGMSATMEWAFNWWVQSGVHYNNMLGNWAEMGVGYADGGQYGKWFVVVFGNAGREPVPGEGHTGVNPSGGSGSSGGGASVSGGSGRPAAPPRPTKPPTATFTPTVTFTPSITFTPRATFTPTSTLTYLPPSETPIVLFASPQAPAESSDPAGATAAPETPVTLTPVAVGMLPPDTPIPAETGQQADPPPAVNGNPLRNVIIPVAIALNVLIVGGLVLNSLRRRLR